MGNFLISSPIIRKGLCRKCFDLLDKELDRDPYFDLEAFLDGRDLVEAY